MVKVDPLVYKYAREYIGPTNGVHLTDARWVHAQSSSSNMFLADLGHTPIKYDYIAHDRFSYLGI